MTWSWTILSLDKAAKRLHFLCLTGKERLNSRWMSQIELDGNSEGKTLPPRMRVTYWTGLNPSPSKRMKDKEKAKRFILFSVTSPDMTFTSVLVRGKPLPLFLYYRNLKLFHLFLLCKLILKRNPFLSFNPEVNRLVKASSVLASDLLVWLLTPSSGNPALIGLIR